MIDMIYTIDEIQSIISPIAASYGVDRVFLFGSYARGEATDESDIDLLVDRGAIRTAFQMGGLYQDLSEALRKELDLVTTRGTDHVFQERIMRDAVLLYEVERGGLQYGT